MILNYLDFECCLLAFHIHSKNRFLYLLPESCFSTDWSYYYFFHLLLYTKDYTTIGFHRLYKAIFELHTKESIMSIFLSLQRIS